MRSSRSLAALVLSAGCLLVLQQQQQGHNAASARSIFASIPGAELARNLSHSFIQTVGQMVDGGINSIGYEISELGPKIDSVSECLDDLCEGGGPPDPDANRSVKEIIESRGFEAREYDVVTRDGYILTIQRIINPLVDESHRPHLKPVILQHGLLSSSVDWVINSPHVHPEAYPARDRPVKSEAEQVRDLLSTESNSIDGHQLASDSQKHPNALGFYLSNQGYDVYLTNSRGNKYGQRHVNMSSWLPKFWDFTFDEQIKYDLPGTIEFIQRLTNQTKVGYVGHSQGTTMVFGLLSDQPEYADIIEPVVALAPVAYVGNTVSPVKYFSVYTPLFSHVNWWFGSSNAAIRYLAPRVCSPEMIRKEICGNIFFLSCGFDEEELDETRFKAYLTHMPSGTSIKNLAHWGQGVLTSRFAHFDHGCLANQAKYGQAKAPDYDLSRIRSKSLALFTAENDWLATPKDVARLKGALRVPLFKAVNVTESVAKWNHIDFVYGKDCGIYVNPEIVDIFNHFRQRV